MKQNPTTPASAEEYRNLTIKALDMIQDARTLGQIYACVNRALVTNGQCAFKVDRAQEKHLQDEVEQIAFRVEHAYALARDLYNCYFGSYEAGRSKRDDTAVLYEYNHFAVFAQMLAMILSEVRERAREACE